MEDMIIAFNDGGTLRECKEPYVTVYYATKEDFEFIQKAVEFYKKMQWIPAENPPEVDEKGYSEYILLNFANATVHEIGQYVADEDGGGAYYIGGDGGLCCSSYGIFVDAWMPLPERYEE
jgi:hypothetical protein